MTIRLVERQAALACAIAALLVGCEESNVAQAQTGGGGGGGAKPAELVKLSQFGHAGSCAIAVDAAGAIHALFSDYKESGKPAHLYYRKSSDDGATWSEPTLVSDDESVLSAGYCRAMVDGKGRLYAMWKYIGVNELLEGPGGPASGVFAWRVFENGGWSRERTIGDEHAPMTSWFAALDAKGNVNVVYSRADPQVDWKGRGMMSYYANETSQIVLDGSAEPKPTVLQAAPHILTQAEQDAIKAAGKYPAYEETSPKYAGLWNLSGYIADDGRPRFLCERYPESGKPPNIFRFDGQKLDVYHEYKVQYPGNTFHNPPLLLRAGDGKEHVIRKPEVGERDVLRDYVVEDGKPGAKTDVIANDAPKATLDKWWASPLAGGKIAAMASLNPQTDVWDATDLTLSVYDGKGAWSKPINVTDNKARATFAAAHGVSSSATYRPTYAAAATLKDGSIGVILLNAEKTITGLNTVGITAGGQAVTGMASFSTEEPYVSFVRVRQ